MTGGNGPFYFSRYSRSSLSHPGTVRLTRLAKQKGLLPLILAAARSLQPRAELPLSGFGRQPSMSLSFSMIKGVAVSCPHEVSYFPIR